MTLQQFDKMSIKDQMDTISGHGVRIGERQDRNLLIILYQIDSFYVERFFSKATMRKIGDRIFEDTNGLLPYLEEISLEDLK